MKSIQVVNIPIQMIVCISTKGEMTPIRFRFEQSDQTICTVQVDRICQRKDALIGNLGVSEFVCQAMIHERMQQFALRYMHHDNCWMLWGYYT